MFFVHLKCSTCSCRWFWESSFFRRFLMGKDSRYLLSYDLFELNFTSVIQLFVLSSTLFLVSFLPISFVPFHELFVCKTIFQLPGSSSPPQGYQIPSGALTCNRKACSSGVGSSMPRECCMFRKRSFWEYVHFPWTVIDCWCSPTLL